jgi:outer membrane protein assembly factor BamB
MKPSIHDILKSLAAAATPVVLICASPALAGAGPLQLIASDWDTNRVTAFDAATGVVLRDVVTTRAHGANAMAGMTVGPDGLTYLTDFATDEVRRYNTKTGALIDKFIPGGL